MPMKIRKIITRSTARVIGRFPSRKARGMVDYESQIEKDFVHRLEACPFVIDFRSQPTKIEFSHNGNPSHYVPDYWVRTWHGSFFAEVKPDSIWDDPQILSRLKSISVAFGERNERFRIFTASEIRRSPHFQNARLVNDFRYSAFVPSKADLLAARAFFHHTPQTTASRLWEHLRGDTLEKTVLPFIAFGQIRMNFGVRFGEHSKLWIPSWEMGQ